MFSLLRCRKLVSWSRAWPPPPPTPLRSKTWLMLRPAQGIAEVVEGEEEEEEEEEEAEEWLLRPWSCYVFG